MTRPTKDLSGEIVVDGQPYVWRLHRDPQFRSDGWFGMVIAVRHGEGQREALMEFPKPTRLPRGSQQLKHPPILPAVLTKAIISAMAAGWEPLSRGKTVIYEVDATGG